MKTYIKTIVIFLLLSFILPTCSSKKSEGINPIILFLLLQNLGIRVGSSTGTGTGTGVGTGTGTGSVSSGVVNVSGTINYENVPVNTATNTLNTSAITNRPARGVVVRVCLPLHLRL